MTQSLICDRALELAIKSLTQSTPLDDEKIVARAEAFAAFLMSDRNIKLDAVSDLAVAAE